MKAQATIRYVDGRIRDAELHWYEAHGIGRAVAYGLLPGFRCGTQLRRVDLPSDYVNKAEAVAEEQIAKAGYRLAWMLDRAFGE